MNPQPSPVKLKEVIRKIIFNKKILLIFVFINFSAFSQVIVKITGINGIKEKEKIYSVFGGTTVKFNLIIFGKERDKELILKADVFQISENLAVPVKKDIPIFCKYNFKEKPYYELEFPLKIPSIKGKTKFLIRFKEYIPEKKKWTIVGLAKICAYPADLLKSLKDFSQKYPVYILGESKNLKDFFDKENIKYEKIERLFYEKLNKPSIIFTEFEKDQFNKLPSKLFRNQVLIVFHPKEETKVPRIIIKNCGEGVLIDVKMPILEKISSPESQEVFVEILNITFEKFKNGEIR